MHSNRRLFLKQLGVGTLSLTYLSGATTPNNDKAMPLSSFPRSTPEQQGLSSAGILSLLDAIDKSNIEFHSLMILRHGVVVAEGWWAPYEPKLTHTLYSLSKSFTSTAVGFAVAEGRLTVDSPVTSFFPKDRPKTISPNLAAMKVKDLLTMSSGHAKDTLPNLRASTSDWAKTFLEIPVDFEPGTHFVYNTGATYMLSAIVQKVTGQTLIEYLKPRLFDPLGIEGMDWETNPEGVNVGGYGLRVHTEDIARLGQLYLQKGKWNGKQILPEKWIADATTSHVDSSPQTPKRPKETDDWAQGYGYQFWRCRNGAYRGDGAFGQYCIVLPDKDIVVAITSESFDMPASLDLIWAQLLPAINSTILPPDEPSLNTLQSTLKSLSLSPPKANVSSLAHTLSGEIFKLDQNEIGGQSVSFAFTDTDCLFTLKDKNGEHHARCGWGKWIIEPNAKTQVMFPISRRPEVSTPLAASATWLDTNTLEMTWRYTATAHSDVITCKFDGKSVTIQFLNSISKGNPGSAEARLPLTGKNV